MTTEPTLAPADVWSDPRERGVSASLADDLQENVVRVSALTSEANKAFLEFQYARERDDHSAVIAAAKRLAASLSEAGALSRRIERSVVAARSSVPTKE